MTCILAIESDKLSDVVVINESISEAYGSGIYIKIDEEIKLIDLLYGLMLRSGNDAAIAIADYISDDFVGLMNKKAVEIGMKNTTFHNPHGLEEEGGNLSTAYDMAVLTSYAMKNEVYREIVGTKKHTVKTNMNYYSWTNKNKLLFNHKYITGGKTGFTEIARRTLVTTASKNNIDLVAVTLNDGNDFADHISMFEEVFNNYTSHLVLKKGNINIPGENYYKNDRLYIKEDFRALLLNNDKRVLLHYELVKKENYLDEEVGKVSLLVDGKKILTQSIYVDKQSKSWWVKFKEWLHDK